MRFSGEKAFQRLLLLAAFSAIGGLGLIALFILKEGLPFIWDVGLKNFLLTKTWDPQAGRFGIFPMIVASLWVTAGAMASSLANLEGIDFYPGPPPGASGLSVEVSTFSGKSYRLKVAPGPEPDRVLVASDWSPWICVVNLLALQRAILPEASLISR